MSEGMNSPREISFSLEFGQDRRRGKKGRDMKFLTQQFCRTQGWPSPAFPRELVPAVEFLQLSFAGQFAFNYREQILEVPREWRTGKGLKSVPVVAAPAPQWEPRGLSPEPSDRWFSPEMFSDGTEDVLYLCGLSSFTAGEVSSSRPTESRVLFSPSDGWMEFRSLILSPEMSFKSTDTFSQQVKLEWHSAGSSLPPRPVPSHRSLSSPLLAAIHASTSPRRCQEQGNGSRLTESSVASAIMANKNTDMMNKFFLITVGRPRNRLPREVWQNGLAWKGP